MGWWLALATRFCWWSSLAQNRERAEDLLAAVEAATSDPVPPGASVANRLAAVIAGRQPGTTPPFGAVAPLAEGYVVLLHGPVSAEIASPLGVVQLSGDQAVTWVDYKVEVAVDRLSVTSHDHPVQVDPLSDLRAGLVPGSGFVYSRQVDRGSSNERRPAPCRRPPPPGGRLRPPRGSCAPGKPRLGPASPALGTGHRRLNQPVGHLLARTACVSPLTGPMSWAASPKRTPPLTAGRPLRCGCLMMKT